MLIPCQELQDELKYFYPIAELLTFLPLKLGILEFKLQSEAFISSASQSG